MRYLQKNSQINSIKLDLKDKKILSLLSENARESLTQIAKKVSLSRDAVSYRIKGYEKSGIIQGYRTIVDMNKFGFSNYHLFIKITNPSKEKEDSILKKLKELPFIRAILKFNGSYDYEIALIAKDSNSLDESLLKINNLFEDLFQKYEILTIIKSYVAETFPPDFISEHPHHTDSQKIEKYIPDEKDIKILKLLSEDATLPAHEIASKLKTSADTISYRIKKMISSKVIIKFVPVINYTSIDYNLYAILLNIPSLTKENEKKLKDLLINSKKVLWSVKTIGRYNCIAYLLVKDTRDFQDTLVELRSKLSNSLMDYEVLLGYEEFKYIYFPSELF